MQTDQVTIVFTDLERSTELLESLGEVAFEQLRRTHFEILRAPLAASGGAEVKNVGDGLMLVFAQPEQALGYCQKVQQMTAEFSERQADRPLRIRMGVHTGTPIRAEDDYFGTAVVVASRLCDRAAGGQILISRATVEGDRGNFADRLLDVGLVRLKGLADPVRAVALGAGAATTSVAVGRGRCCTADGRRIAGRSPRSPRADRRRAA